MTLTARSSLAMVAFAAGDALRRAGIDATLTGGSCATVHSSGAYQSLDIDFVLRSVTAVSDLDRVLATLGFGRDGTRYVHPRVRYFIEFPVGPLAIGRDYQITPVQLRLGSARILALSPTDACRDRLAAFYHWHDRPSLEAALAIASRQRIDLRTIQHWSRTEGALAQFQEFRSRLAAQRHTPKVRSAR